MINMTIEELKEHKMNAVAILEEEMEYATAKVTEEAFNVLIWLKEASEAFDGIPSYHEVPLPKDAFDYLKT